MARMADQCAAQPTLTRIGTSSWSDRSLTQDSHWFPRKTMKAAERIAFYSQHFSLVEMEGTHRFPPTPAITTQWVERTPSDFRFDIPAWSLLSGRAAFPPSLYEDLWKEVRPDCRDKPRLYANHLSDQALSECWDRFVHSLSPLIEANKLGAVVLRFPHWLRPGSSATALFNQVRMRLGNLPAAVEVSHRQWFTAANCENTFDLLEDLDFSFVCLDAPPDHPRSAAAAQATTNGLGLLRLIGRQPYEDRDGWGEDFRSYRYTDAELNEIANRLRHLQEGCDELHVIASTRWKDDAVVNATRIGEMLGVHPGSQHDPAATHDPQDVIDLTDPKPAHDSKHENYEVI